MIRDLVQAEDKKYEFILYNRRRLNTSFVLVLSVFFLFIARIFYWQVFKYDILYRRAIEANTCFLKTDAVRGEIYDRDGIGLAVNSLRYRVIIERLDVPEGKENELIAKLVNFTTKLGNNFFSSLPIVLNDLNNFEFSKDKEEQVKYLKKILKLPDSATASHCIDKLSEKFKCENFNACDRYHICSVKYNNFRLGISSKASPLTIFDNVNEKSVSILIENSYKIPGMKIGTSLKRYYTFPETFAHIIGYTGIISNQEYEKYRGKYSLDSTIGKTGAELAFEEILRGYHGQRAIQLSKDNSIINSNQVYESKSGNSVILTLSSKLQNAASESLKRNIMSAKKNGAQDCNSGAAVVIDLRDKDFGILAAVSYPNFNLQKYIENNEYNREITNDKLSPLINRAFCACYAPGSTIKPLIALAALEENLINREELIKCNGSFNYFKNYNLHCMGRHGNIDLGTALVKSCNVVFAELGRRLGANRIAEYAKKFGLGIKTGVELPEKEGILSTPERNKKLGIPWYPSFDSQIGIGQADTSFTPVQLALCAGVIATGENRKLHVLKQVMDYPKNNVVYKYEPKILGSNLVSEENLNLVIGRMKEVTYCGTASDFKNFPIETAGKTGTSQNKGSDHTSYMCFTPEIAIFVIVANGKYGAYSKSVARDILKCHYNLK
ncbi:MAG: penicillin-binding protein [Candidatus Improbicoccus pseudotrichonymphae]|uniref:Penicillin-binding protein n=1 Tax=Candidatus Improbicoccus pseudotrichonymphae TaxID=3033792 RepID=A0AA48KZB0_9FIRM|nr:MAG: penicillin-binding protein [Candidatus Improbicoccus pseudotrichonymphae]